MADITTTNVQTKSTFIANGDSKSVLSTGGQAQ